MYGLVQVYICFVFFGVDISRSTMSISLLSLKELWSNIDDEVDVYEFYGHALNDWGPSSPLSNFFEAEYEYTIPEWVFECVDYETKALLDLQSNSVKVRCSEAAIMLVKALIFNDAVSFNEIKNFHGKPKDIKALGRQIKNFNDSIWLSFVIQVAEDVVLQKFSKRNDLQNNLAYTQGRIIVEATDKDHLWANGLEILHLDG